MQAPTEQPPTVFDKLKSRKWWITLGAAFVILFGRELGLDLTDDQIWATATVAASYAGAGQLAKVLHAFAKGGSAMLASGVVTEQVDDKTPIDGTEYERVERRSTSPHGVELRG